MYAESGNIGLTINTVVEATTIWKALKYYNLRGFEHNKLKMNSLSLKHILRKDWRIPWDVVHIIEDFMTIMQGINIHAYS